MRKGIFVLLVVFGQFSYAEEKFCEVEAPYSDIKVKDEINAYVLETCREGDFLQILDTKGAPNSLWRMAGEYCKLGTMFSPMVGVVQCEYRKLAREEIRPNGSEWRQMKKDSKK